MSAGSVCAEVINERWRQDQKWGDQLSKPSEVWLAILVEEVGEVAREILDQKSCYLDRMRKEMIQVAAVSVCFVEAIDRAIERAEQ